MPRYLGWARRALALRPAYPEARWLLAEALFRLRDEAAARESAVFTIVAAIERPEHPILAKDAGEIAGVGTIGVPITTDLQPTPQVLIDFTSAP